MAHSALCPSLGPEARLNVEM